MNKILYLVIISMSFVINSKIHLLTFHYNRPDFIEYQHKCFQKFLSEKDDYELIVFNDAPSEDMSKSIENMCAKYGIKCIRFEQTWHEKTFLTDEIEAWSNLKNITGLRELSTLKGRHPSVRHCHAIQYALENFAYNHDDICGLIDGDMFLIRPFSLRNYMKNHDFIGTLKKDETGSVEFMWVALSFFNMGKLPNKTTLRFNLTKIGNRITDSGGHSYFYLKDNPTVKSKKYGLENIIGIRNLSISDLNKKGYSSAEISFIKRSNYSAEFHMDKNFLHYSRSSFIKDSNPYAPETQEYHNLKSDTFTKFLNEIL